MLRNILIGSILLLITTGIHTLVTKGIVSSISKLTKRKKRYLIPKSYWIGFVVLTIIFATVFESLVWAVAYLRFNVIEGLEEAVYFSLVSYTTLGFGDITLSESYRLMSAIEAANGIIIFGWSTAIVMAIVQHIYLAPSDKG